MEEETALYHSQVYMFLKARYMLVKCHTRLRQYTQAEFAVDQIHGFTDDYQTEEPQLYWKFAVKALYVKAKQIAHMMEFRKAKETLEKEAKPILKRLIGKY